jgi:predicted phage terminase large subunit-like protein
MRSGADPCPGPSPGPSGHPLPASGARGMDVTPAEVQAALRQDFYSFLVRAFVDRNGGAAFLAGWHIEAMAAKLGAVAQGRARRLIVNIPPRHLKSLAASIALPAWLLGRDPGLAIVNATYAQDLSDAFARDCRALMGSPWYRSLFSTRLRAARPPLRDLITTEGGFRMATSVGGVLTGRGADVILIDDPIKPADAMSESRRAAANSWFDGTLYSRLNDKARGAIVIVMQRLHEDDLVGHVLKQEGWEVVSFPAIAETDEDHEIETPFGPKRFSRQAGEALHPEREALATLEHIRATIGDANFAGQYQQRPAPAGGGMIRADWFRRYGAGEAPRFERIVQSWDTANKPTELADYSVCTTWGMKGPDAFLIDVYRKRLAFPELQRAIVEQDGRFCPEAILIEDRASGTQAIQALVERGLAHVTRISPEGDKIMRVHAETATIENGFVHLPREAPWLAEYLRELTLFPAGRHDDQVDSTAQALAWMKRRPRAPGMMEHWRAMAAEEGGGRGWGRRGGGW